MTAAFYVAAVVAIVATVLAISRTVAVHALLYVIVSLLSIATMFVTLGAPFAAALEVIVYAGAIMVLFVFVVMLLDPGPAAARSERATLSPRAWVGPSLLAAVLVGEMLWSLARASQGVADGEGGATGPHAVGRALFGPYVLGVEIASLLLLAGLVAAYHIGSRGGDGAREEGTPS